MKIDSVSNLNPTAPAMERPQLRLPSAPVPQQASAGAAAAVAVLAAQAVDHKELKQALEEVNRAVQSHGGSLEFSVDQHTRKTVVRIVDTSTNQVIRQFPSEEMLAIARSLDKLQGLLIKQQA